MDIFNHARPTFNERTVLAGNYSDNCFRYANYGSENYMQNPISNNMHAFNIKGKVQFTPSNFHQSPDFNLKLQNQITLALQLLKPFNFQPSGRFWR